VRLYPDVPANRRSAFVRDLLVLVLLLALAWLGPKVHDSVQSLAGAGRYDGLVAAALEDAGLRGAR
jgi:hypothetical protein